MPRLTMIDGARAALRQAGALLISYAINVFTLGLITLRVRIYANGMHVAR